MVLRKLGCSLMLVGAIPAIPAVQAQENGRGYALEEVVVTARRREEGLQDTPVAVSAFGAADIEERNIMSPADVSQYVPNLQFDSTAAESGGGSSSQISIRGIGQTDYVITVEPGVGLYLDGVYIGKSVGSLIETVDLERIEVLRGPQGTLFGKNTIGGAVVLTSKRPSAEPEFSLDVTTGRFDRLDVRTSISGAVHDRLRLRFSGASFDRDGHVRRVLTGQTQGDRDVLSGRLTAELDVSDNLLATFSIDGMRSDEPSPGQVLIRTSATEGFANFNTSGQYDDRWTQPLDARRNFSRGGNSSETSVWGTNLTLDWDLGEFALKSITAYRTVDSEIFQDLTLNPVYVNEIGQDIDIEQVSQEFQITGTLFEERLNYLVGFFWMNESGSQAFPVLLEAVEFVSGGSIDNDSTAIFAQVDYDVTDRLRLTLGARYTWEKRRYTPEQRMLQVNNPGVVGLFGSFGFPASAFDPGTPLFPEVQASDSDSRFTPSVTVDYQFTDEVMGYFTYSRGFKGGGFTMRGFPPALPGITPGIPANADPASLVPRFGPEKAEVFELGFKSQLWDNRARLNVAGFVTNYDDLQILANSGLLAFVPIIVNAGDARMWGVEVEAEVVPTDWLRINGGFGWLDHEYLRVDPIAAGVTEDSRIPNAPEWTATLGGTVDLMQNDFGHVFMRADWSYKASQFKMAVNSPAVFQGSYDLLNASLNWRSPNEQWLATLGATNLTNEIYKVSVVENTGIGYAQAVVSRPREWYLRLKYNF